MQRLLMVLTGAFVCAACGPAVDPASLPAVPEVATERYQSAVRAQLDEAIAAFAARPMSAARNGELGMLYRAYRDFDAAETLFARARALAPGRTDWMYYHGEVLEQLGRTQEALAAFEQVLEREPSDLAARLHAARMRMNLGQLDAAIADAMAVRDKQPRIADAHVLAAEVLTRAGRLDEATQAWEGALARFGSFSQAHYALAQLYRRGGRRDAAERQLWQFGAAIRETPPAFDPRLAELFKLNVSDRALVLAAQAAKARGETDEALALLERALERNPQNLETRASLVSGYAAQARVDDAMRHAREGLAIDPQHVELGLASARLALSQGKTRDAQAQLAAITERSPKHAAARAWLGRAHELRGQQATAGEHYARAVAIDPAQRTARRFYIAWLANHASPDTAAAALDKLVQTPARDAPLAYLALAEARLRLGERPAARAALDAGIERAQWLENDALERRLRNRRARPDIGGES